MSSAGKPWGDGVTEKLAWQVVKEFAARIGNRLTPHDLRRFAESRSMPNQFQNVLQSGEFCHKTQPSIRLVFFRVSELFKKLAGCRPVCSGLRLF